MGEAKRRKTAGTYPSIEDLVPAQQQVRSLIIPRFIIEDQIGGVIKTIGNVERLFHQGRRNQVLMVDGYNDDQRELYEIDDVINHLMEVTRLTPLPMLVSPSSLAMLLRMKLVQRQIWYENSNRRGEPEYSVTHLLSDFITSQIDWLNTHYPTTDEEEDKILSSSFENPDLSQVSESGRINFRETKLFGSKMLYTLEMGEIKCWESLSSTLDADRKWTKKHPDFD